jgi:hypothetical protein
LRQTPIVDDCLANFKPAPDRSRLVRQKLAMMRTAIRAARALPDTHSYGYFQSHEMRVGGPAALAVLEDPELQREIPEGSGGRQRGSPNKRTLEVIDKLAALRCDPITGMAKLAMDKSKYAELAQYARRSNTQAMAA